MKYALLDSSNTVVNMIEWDGITQYVPLENHTLYSIEGLSVDFGYKLVDGVFNPPAPTE